MSDFYVVVMQGFFISASLLVGIGPQNGFILKQGILKNHLLPVVLCCTLIDLFLIFFGIAGAGEIFSSNQYLLLVAKWGGAAFLFWCGFQSFCTIQSQQVLKVDKNNLAHRTSLKSTLLTLLGLSLLNPHVYLDTVVLIGGVSSQYLPEERMYFAIGASLGSFSWFFSLCYGAKLLAPCFEKEISWKILNFSIGCMMWYIGFSLLIS